MLIRFVVENFKSFKEETEFNLLTGSVRKHSGHVHHTNQGIDVLPTAVVYGGNASGKSNLIKAIDVAREIVLNGTQSKNSSFPIEKFALSNNNSSFSKPVKFEFEFKKGDKIFAYGFTIDYDKVIEEWLYNIPSKNKDVLIFEREGESIKFHTSLTSKKNDREFLANEVRGLRINQLFLTESPLRNIHFLSEIFEWFQDLIIFYPTMKYRNLDSFSTSERLDFTNFLLDIGDTGVSVNTRKVGFNNLMTENPKIRKKVENNYSYIKKYGIGIETENVKYSIVFNESLQEMEAVKLISIHKSLNGEPVVFETYQESDGTQRLMDLAGVIFPSIFENKVLIIDEIDRSLHPLLSKKLIEIFLEKRIANKGTGQLICTTHEDLMIDMNILRPDEVWFVQKNDEGASELYPLSEFKIRYDIDVRKGYLNGRFGAIPDIKTA